MTGTTELHEEHVGVSRSLQVLDAMSGHVKAGEQLPAEHFSDILEYVRVFVDACHHGKEEQVLFPAMIGAQLPGAEEIVSDLLVEHVQGRDLVARITDASGRHTAGDSAANGELVEAIAQYSKLIHGHIRREENDCFVVANHGLSAEAQEKLNEDYERIEQEVIGEGRHEALSAMLDRLSAAYVRKGTSQ